MSFEERSHGIASVMTWETSEEARFLAGTAKAKLVLQAYKAEVDEHDKWVSEQAPVLGEWDRARREALAGHIFAAPAHWISGSIQLFGLTEAAEPIARGTGVMRSMSEADIMARTGGAVQESISGTGGTFRSQYPGNFARATAEEISSFRSALNDLGVGTNEVMVDTPTFNPRTNTITFDPKTATVGDLIDEYLHAWNEVNGRGSYLSDLDARIHRGLGYKASEYGSAELDNPIRTQMNGYNQNDVFHQLEMHNFLEAGETAPKFMQEFLDAMQRYLHLMPG